MAGLWGYHRLVEIVPNFSEGRNQNIIKELGDAVGSVDDVYLLDRHSDQDHHRTVLTIVGTPEGVAQVSYLLAEKARSLIDLRNHDGVHPRVGALDVVPCIPFFNSTMAECVELARAIGLRIGRELAIPVFLYEEAATHSSRKNLAHIRQGGLGKLQERMDTQSNWMPDFGPPVLHPSGGASVVGARSFLIAFNMNLLTSDVRIAKNIAKLVRDSNGGLPFLKAIGIALPSQGLVQVSMNLTDYKITSLQQAYEAVKAEATGLRVGIQSSEIVGLVPQEAIEMCSSDIHNLIGLKDEQILEKNLESKVQKLG